MPVEGRGLTSEALWKGSRVWRLTLGSSTSIHDSAIPETASGSVKGQQACWPVGRLANSVGEPGAENLHARFDEGEVETEYGKIFGHRQPKGPATRKASLSYRATSLLYSLTTFP